MIINKITNVKNMGSYFIEFKNTIAQEQDGEKGLSHLVEHCMCEQVKSIEKKFHELGIIWNAYTSTSSVCYYMSGLCKSIKKFIPEFTDKILNYNITEDVFNREKQVVISEYMMYYNENYERFTNNWFRKHYNYTNECGLLEDLKNITYSKFIEFKNRVFNKPDNVIFIHSKNISDIENLDKIEFKDNLCQNNYNDFSDSYDKFPMEYYSTGIDSQRLLMFGYPLLSNNKTEFIKNYTLLSMLNYFMCGGLTAYLYKEIREKYACVYAISSFSKIFDDKKHMFVGFIFETEEKNVELLTKVIHKCMKKLLKNITKRKFNSIYKIFKAKYKVQSNTDFNSLSYFCDEDMQQVINYIMNNKVSFKEFIEFITKLTDNYKIYNDIDYIPKKEEN